MIAWNRVIALPCTVVRPQRVEPGCRSEHDESWLTVGRLGPMTECEEAEAFVEAAGGAVDVVGLEPTAVSADAGQPCLERGPSEPGTAQMGITSHKVEGERPFECRSGVSECGGQFMGPVVILFRPGPEMAVGD